MATGGTRDQVAYERVEALSSFNGNRGRSMTLNGAITSHSSNWQRDANFDEPHRRADRQTNTGDY